MEERAGERRFLCLDRFMDIPFSHWKKPKHYHI
jgi:hypothetical protein